MLLIQYLSADRATTPFGPSGVRRRLVASPHHARYTTAARGKSRARARRVPMERPAHAAARGRDSLAEHAEGSLFAEPLEPSHQLWHVRPRAGDSLDRSQAFGDGGHGGCRDLPAEVSGVLSRTARLASSPPASDGRPDRAAFVLRGIRAREKPHPTDSAGQQRRAPDSAHRTTRYFRCVTLGDSTTRTVST